MYSDRTHDYEWLFLDLDNTILDFQKSSELAFIFIFSELGLSLSHEDYKRYKEINSAYWLKLEKGDITFDKLKVQRWEDFLSEMNFQADPAALNDAYLDHIAHHPLYIPDALESLQKFHSRYRLMLITNGLANVQLPRLRITGLNEFFEHIVISEQLGYSKPSREFFDHCHGLSGSPMHDMVLVIGDTLTSDIGGGLNYGYHTCWYNYHKSENQSEYRPHYEVQSHKEIQQLLLASL